jgi:chromate reductase
MSQPLRILGIPGSLRRASWNRAALEALKELLPPGVELEIFDLAGIPLFNEEQEAAPDARVLVLREAVRAADGVYFATPEYNYSIPGVLKNAIDWASRPYGQGAWQGKPAAILSASTGTLGGIRAQYHLRQVLVSQDMPVVSQPEVVIGQAPSRFDAAGRLTDEVTRNLLSAQLAALIRLMEAARGKAGAIRSGSGKKVA